MFQWWLKIREPDIEDQSAAAESFKNWKLCTTINTPHWKKLLKISDYASRLKTKHRKKACRNRTKTEVRESQEKSELDQIETNQCKLRYWTLHHKIKQHPSQTKITSRLRILDEFQKIRENMKKGNFGEKHGFEVLVRGFKKLMIMLPPRISQHRFPSKIY